MKKFLVPFEEQETVWCKYLITVEAKSAQAALNKVKKVVARGDSIQVNFGFEECEFVEITEHIHSDCEYNIDDYSVDDVVAYDDRIACELSLSAFDIARYGKDELYRMAEEKFMRVGLDLDIQDMDLIPIKIEEHYVAYNAIPTEYIRTFSNGETAKRILK
ncbi:hypothetical protein [Sulfurimonas sp.]|uniref:hypothetical protein n=1 Tax=Sulfurimonas sp. TaxID=2022749 RepID=UPI0025FF277B|nr:hypothetical protein [Sulfurimonas sp.]MBW6487488.1 hypothetical protein [Sulfurimonas sp.]